MKFDIKFFVLFLLVFFLTVGFVSANEIGDVNVTSINDESSIGIADDMDYQENDFDFDESNVLQASPDDLIQSDDDVIVVNDWDELQYYCAQTDKDYTLKLKENTNFYPTNPNDANYQINVKNNVKIYGSEGSYIGDNSSDAREIHFVAILVEDYTKVGLTLDNITFKWIKSVYSKKSRDGIFIQMGGIKNNVIRNCKFSDVKVDSGHATIVYLKKGNTLLDNCSFINCTSEYGVVSVYDPNSVKSTDMIVRNCYFEGNYAETEPGCINNCGKLTVYNTTFIKNRSFWWAGAIHTHNSGNTTIYDSRFIDNVAGWNGGALYTYSYLQIYNSIFIGNNCTTNNGGGAIGACQYQSNPHIYIEKCLFENNANNCWSLDELSTDGTGRGGAISLMDIGSIEVRETTFVANSASIGTAICAIAVGGYGSPDIIIVNNSFINHTRVGDVLNVRVDGTLLNISNNQYYGNSIEFSSLILTKRNVGKDKATFGIAAKLTNPGYYDSDILDKTSYDVYVNNEYVKTVNSKVFSVDFGDLDICSVYVIPTISNKKSNELYVTSTREYIFVSKNKGNDNNNGATRDKPVNTISRALELARNCQNIILLDGDYSEENIPVDYDVTIKGESGATLSNATSFIVNANSFTLKNLNINNLNTDTFIKQDKGNLVISNCIFENNRVSNIFDAKNTDISKSIFINTVGSIVYNNGVVNIVNSILLNNSQVIAGNDSNINLDYNWWGNSVPNLNINHVLTLNVTSDKDSLENNQKSNVRFGFYLNDSKYAGLPEINLIINTVNGLSSENVTSINSNVVYTLTAFEDGILTVSYNDFSINKEFVFLKSNPNVGVVAKDVMFFEDVTVQVKLPKDVSGNLTVNVGDKTQNIVINSSYIALTFKNLIPDCYTVCVNYSGDRKYSPQLIYTTANVNKYESVTNLNIDNIEVGEDLTLTITTNAGTTGNVTLSINEEDIVLKLNNSMATHIIKNIKRGDYLIKAVYNGDINYKESIDSKFIEVDNLNVTMNIEVDDITYGEVAVVKVSLNNDASGQVIVTVDGVVNSSDVVGGSGEVKLYGVDAGENKNISIFYTGDNTYFNLTKETTFTVNKADLVFNISSIDIKIGQNGEINIQVPQKTVGTFTIGDDVLNIPLSGVVSYVIPDLEIGNYTYTATFNGNNYYAVSNSTSFTVSEYPVPQVSNEGFNIENTHKSQYETLVNGNVAFSIPFNETLSGDLVIDSLGNVYLPTQSGIYAFNQTSQLWYFTSTAVMGNLSGIAISRDVIVAPKSGDTLFFVNQTTGERWGESNIYHGSSLFAPVVTSDATLYITSEYQTASEDYKLTIIPYGLWENGGDPIRVSIGNTQPLCSPTLNENIIVIISDNRLRLIDAKTLETISIKSGNFQPTRPIMGEGNIVYSILSNTIVAYNSAGAQVWKTRVTGGVGTVLALDNEQGLYHVNAKGLLYKYDLIDGSESKVSNLKVTSGLLIGTGGTLYFGSNNIFYAMDSEGNVLWKSDLKSKILRNPVMDKNGLIYVPTENGITALTYAPLTNPDLSVQVDDIVEGEKATITIAWNNQTAGCVSYTVNGENITVDAANAKVTKVISGLAAGYYDISVSYNGDMRFKESTVTKTFAVRSTDDVANNIQFDGNQTFTFSLNNAQGNLTVNVAGKTYSKELINGQASISIDKLSPGDWDAVVTYSGDRQFNKANRTFSIEIPRYSVELNEVIATENVVSRISVSLPADATGNLTLSVGTKKYTETITAGNAVIVVDDLPEGNYSATLAYSGDDNYESVSKAVSINLAKIRVILDESNVIVKSGAIPKVSIRLDDNATGSFMVTVDGEEYLADVSEELIISGLEPGNYTATLTYSGDFRYSKAVREISFEVPKIIIDLNETVITENVVSTVSVSLLGDASGELTVSVGTKKYTDNVRNGKAGVVIDDLGEGNWTAVISYSNDAKYESVTKTVELNHVRIPVELNIDVVSPCETPEVSVALDSQATGSIAVSVGGGEFSADLTNGSATVKITGLSPGNYSAVVTYSGDFKFAKSVKTITVEVPKITLDLNDSIYVSKITDGILVEVSLPSDARGDINVTVNGKDYVNSLSNGFTSFDINGLNPGNYTASFTYSGDGKYDKAVKTFDFEVPKIALQFNDSNLIVSKISGGIIVDIALPGDASGNVIVSFDGKNYTDKLTDGASSVKISDVAAGNWQANVTYTGNDKYGSISKVIQFAVDMIDISFNDSTLSVISPSSQPVVSVRFDTNVTGNIIVTVNDMQFIKELVDGSASLNITGLTPGNYTATLTYSGDERYGATERTIKVEVPRITTTLDNVMVKSNVTVPVVSVILPSDAGGNLIVNISGNVYIAKVINGNCSIEIVGLAPGNYTGVVSYSGDSNYTDAHKTVSLEVPKIIISLNDNNCKWNASQIAVNINNATGSLTVEIRNETYTKALTDGSAVVEIDDLNPGSYDVKIIYSGDDVFTGAEKIVRLEIPKIKVNLDDSLTVDSANVNVDLQEDATGEVTVVVSGKSFTKELTDGKATVDVSGLYPGSYNATVIYFGDNKYDSATKTVKVKVPKVATELNNDTLRVNASSSISIALPADATGNLTVTVEGKTFTEVLVDGKATVNVDGLAPGSYNATVSYSGDNKYDSATKTVDINVPKVVTEINNETLVVDIDDSSSVSISLPADATGTLTVNVDGLNYTETLTNGKVTVSIPEMAPGAHDITVTYSGDEKYSSLSSSCVVEVSKHDCELTVDAGDISVGEKAVVNVKVDSKATGNVTITINNKEYSAVIKNGIASISVDDLVYGNYGVGVRYDGDANFNGASNFTRFNVLKVNVPLTNETISIPDANSTEYAVSLPSDATGTLTVTVDGKTYSETLTDGKATVSIPELSGGSHNITVAYSGDGKYESMSRSVVVNVTNVKDNSTNVTVVKVNPALVVGASDINVGDDAIITVKTSVVSGKLTVNVNSRDYEVSIANGESKLTVCDLASGSYVVIARFAGDDEFNAASNSTEFNVLKVVVPITNETINIPEGNSTEYGISLPENATGNLTVTVDGKSYSETLTDGKATVSIPELDEGSHNITVSYSGDGNYEQISKSAVVNVVNNTISERKVVKVDPALIVSASDINVGDDALITVKTSVGSGKLTVNVNSRDYEVSIANGESKLTVFGLDAGNYEVIVRFEGDDEFNEAASSAKFNVLKVIMPVTNETIIIPEDNSTEYSISLPDDANGTLTVTVDGVSYTKNLSKGKATVSIPKLREGSHNVIVTYSGDEKYETIARSTILKVNATAVKADPVLVVSAGDVTVGDDVVISVKSSVKNANVTVSVNGMDYVLVVGDGEARLSISDLGVGNYTAIVSFAGDDEFNPAANSTVFNVLKRDVSITNETITPAKADSTEYSISLPSDATGTFTVTVDGKEYSETLSGGKATVTIPALSSGSHNITVAYSGDAKYSAIASTSVVTKEPVLKLTGSNLNMLYTSGKYFKVRLTADGQPLAGKSVKITINGKTYSRTTDSNGYASLKISLPPKTYAVKASYGNVSVAKNVVVKSVITAKNVNVKKSAKTVKIKVTLKKVNSKYLKNKWVSLKFNKKTFKVKTTKKGVATFTIKNSVFKNLKVNKKYTYQVTYGKDKVKKTIKFKK